MRHIPAVRPANVGVGIVLSRVLVVRVINPRSRGPGHNELKLLFVEKVSGNRQPHKTCSHDPPFRPAEPCGQLDRLITWSGGHDQNSVRSLSVGQVARPGNGIGFAEAEGFFDSELLRKPHSFRRNVQANRVAARSLEDLTRQKTK